MNFSQPNFYRFSQTSVEASTWLSAYLNERNLRQIKICDLFCGCGILSLELAFRLPAKIATELNLVELQPEFKQHLEINCNTLKSIKPNITFQIWIQDSLEYLSSQSNANELDTIYLLNPPHFFLGEGQKTSSVQRDQCIYMEEKNWIRVLSHLDGKCVFLLTHNTKLSNTLFDLKNKNIRIIQPMSGKEILVTTF